MSQLAEPKNQTKYSFKVLVADDDKHDRMLIQRAWNENGPINGLDFVSDGEELLDYLKRRGDFRNKPRPDIILLDLHMPRVSGREALLAIKSDIDLDKIPIVILTTSHSSDDIDYCYSMGCCSYVTKPEKYQDMVISFDRLRKFWFEESEIPGRFQVLGANRLRKKRVFTDNKAIIDELHRLNPHILVVENSTINQRVVSNTLMQLGCRVTMARDAEVARDLIKKVNYDLVFMNPNPLEGPQRDSTPFIKSQINDDSRLISFNASGEIQGEDDLQDDYLSDLTQQYIRLLSKHLLESH